MSSLDSSTDDDYYIDRVCRPSIVGVFGGAVCIVESQVPKALFPIYLAELGLVVEQHFCFH